MKNKSDSNITTLNYGVLSKLQESKDEVTYKQLCECLEIPYLSSNSKNKQLKELKSICDIEKNGTKFKIVEIRSNRDVGDRMYRYKVETDSRMINDNNFNVDFEQWNLGGVYKIKIGNCVYIGQTSNFRKRYLQHRKGYNKNSPTKQMLLDGATFEVLNIIEDKKERIEKESQYIATYSDCIDIILVNKQRWYMSERKRNKNYFKNIKVNSNQYDFVISLLEENKIDYKRR